jgi:TFIIF-interacting CTD phosphatase-like protein
VDLLKARGDIIVYTTAKQDYAEKICELLSIKPKALLSREDCLSYGDSFKKSIKKEWMEKYTNIYIIDDSPQVWNTCGYKVLWLIPKEFRGDKDDRGLQSVIEQIKYQ